MIRPYVRHDVELLGQLIRRDLESRYRGSALGAAWSFLEPLWHLALLTLVFRVVLQVRLEGELSSSFPIFLFAGFLPWMTVQASLTRSTTAFLDHGALLKSRRCPAELFVATPVLAELVHASLAAGVFLLVLAAIGQLSLSGLWLLLIAVPLHIALVLGLGLLLALAQLFFRDVQRGLGLALSTWFYVTPIVYPLSTVPEPLHVLIQLNPLTGLTALYRAALLGGRLEFTLALASLVVAALLSLTFGLLALSAGRPVIVDEV